MNKWFLVAFVCVIAVFSSIPALAQEENVEYAWGTVKSASSNQIVVMEYDYDADEDVAVTYSVDPKTELKGVKTLKDIAAGDTLDVEYVVQGGKKIAKVVNVEKSSAVGSEEDNVPQEMYEEEWDYRSEVPE